MNRKIKSLGKSKLFGLFFCDCIFNVSFFVFKNREERERLFRRLAPTSKTPCLVCGGVGKGTGVFGFEQEMLAFEVVFSSPLSDARDPSKVVAHTLLGSIS